MVILARVRIYSIERSWLSSNMAFDRMSVVLFHGNILDLQRHLLFSDLFDFINDRSNLKMHIVVFFRILLGPLLSTWNYICYKVWNEITYPFPNFHGCTFELWELISYLISHFIIDVITYPSWYSSWSLLVKWAPANKSLTIMVAIMISWFHTHRHYNN